jgi:hypothetical protein
MKMYAAGVLIAVVIAVRLVLWARFRNDSSGRRIGIGTLQVLFVIAGVAVMSYWPQWTLSAFVCVLIGIIALSFVPARRRRV